MSVEGAYPCNHFCCFTEVGASLHSVGLGQIILDQTKTNIVTHLVKLFIHLHVVALIIFA